MRELLTAILDNLPIFLAAIVVAVFLISRLKFAEDAIYAVLSLGLFTIFTGYLVYTLLIPDLSIVVIVVILFCVADFIQGLREAKENGVDAAEIEQDKS